MVFGASAASAKSGSAALQGCPRRLAGLKACATVGRAYLIFDATGSVVQRVTVTVTSSNALSPPSCARQRRTYVPGSANVARLTQRPSAGAGGVRQPRDHGE